MNKTIKTLLYAAAISCFSFTCAQAAEKITTAGSSTIRPIVKKDSIVFIDFLLSTDGQRIVKSLKFIRVN